MRKPAIPAPSSIADRQTARALMAVKENIDVITGAVGAELPTLLETATLLEVIRSVNAIITRLNRSGT